MQAARRVRDPDAKQAYIDPAKQWRELAHQAETLPPL
jgi:hypothetical protein